MSSGARDGSVMGSAALAALIGLIAISPVMRGGNRHIALIVLEGISLLFLLALVVGSVKASDIGENQTQRVLLWILLLSPLWLGVIYLTPIPSGWWTALPGHQVYPGVMHAAGIPLREFLPVSLVPDATQVSLISALPLAAGFLGGYLARTSEVRKVFIAVVIVALIEVIASVLQVIGGPESTFYFGGYFGWGGRPIGTFGNANHLANYLNMALVAYAWLGSTLFDSRAQHHAFGGRWPRLLLLWSAGAVFMVLGVLLTRSRGALLTGLPLAALAFGVMLSLRLREKARMLALSLALVAVTGAVAITGADFALSRFGGFGPDAAMRRTLASDTFRGAWAFFPWGAGWGTFAGVFSRFQSPQITGIANYAHADYAQLVFEGGIFAVLLIASCAWLFIERTWTLVRSVRRHGGLSEQMASVLAGIGLLGFLVHSIAEFNMHIPANAILAGLLAGVFLRTRRRSVQAYEGS